MKLFSLIIIFICITISGYIFAQQKTVTFATSEREPYIGNQLQGNGYVAKLVTEAFKRVGYQVKLEYYPLARSRSLAEMGKVHGLLPVSYDKSSENFFIL